MIEIKREIISWNKYIKGREIFQMNNIKFTIINIIILSNLIFGSSDFGKIRGKIIAIEDSTWLIGVNISILDTDLGAVSDEKGNYTIIGIPSGVYSVRFDYIGRQSKTFKNIYVESSLSTSLNVQLSQSVIESEAIIVSGARKIIQPDVTTSTVYIGQDEMQKLPVTELRDALMLQAGVFFDPIRFCLQLGEVMLVSQALGRLDIQLEGDQEEIMWMIDGFRTQSLTINARDAGGSFMNINSLAIKEIQILSGGFTAEYGNAQSGVVNVIMKEGQNKLGGGLQISYSPPGQRHFWKLPIRS